MLQKFDPRNADLLIYVNGEILPRAEARISVLDSVVQGGDAVWEGLRLYREGVYCLDRHMRRLMDSAHALDFQQIPSVESIVEALGETFRSNGMEDDVHVRLTLTRGEKLTSGMDPRLCDKGCGLIILPEWKPPVYDNEHGITVFTSSIRRNGPEYLDSKIHHNNLLNNILAKTQANYAGCDAALMLDSRGFASELNGTNLFMIRDGIVYTPYAHHCLPGITRGRVIEICKELSMTCHEKDISLTELYTADIVWATGTMGELTPIRQIDGREIAGRDEAHAMFDQIVSSFVETRASYCTAV